MSENVSDVLVMLRFSCHDFLAYIYLVKVTAVAHRNDGVRVARTNVIEVVFRVMMDDEDDG